MTSNPRPKVPRRPSVPRSRCYWQWCEAPATTDDHVPPRAFFFEGTEIEGENLKENRFTVRSCREHNEPFSNDEEYVTAFAYMAAENDPRAHQHAVGKQFDTLRKKREELLGRRLEAAFNVPPLLMTIRPAPGYPLRVELPAMHRVGEKIARGLHYRLTGERLQGNVIVWAPNFGGGDPRRRDQLQRIGDTFDSLPYDTGVSGHSLVFEYGHQRDPRRRYVSMKFRFFRGFELRAVALSPWRNVFDELPDWPPTWHLPGLRWNVRLRA